MSFVTGDSVAARLSGFFLALVVVLVTLPRQRFDHFECPLVSHQLRSSVERHTFLERTTADTAEGAASRAPVRHVFDIVNLFERREAHKLFELILPIPLTLLLLRLKLGSAAGGSPDPLL